MNAEPEAERRELTTSDLIEIGKLSPPFDPVTEGDLLHFVTGLAAVLRYGSEVASVLDEENQTHEDRLRAAAKISIGDQEQTGALTGSTDEAPPVAATPAPPAPAATPVEPNPPASTDDPDPSTAPPEPGSPS